LLSKDKILPSFLLYDNIEGGRGGYMVKERKAITVRVSPELKFQIDKAAAEDSRTVNSWIIHLIKQHLGSEKK
jgi:hypothetical protein